MTGAAEIDEDASVWCRNEVEISVLPTGEKSNSTTAPSPAAGVRHPEMQVQRQNPKSERLIANYRGGSFHPLHASSATMRNKRKSGAQKSWPPAAPDPFLGTVETS